MENLKGKFLNKYDKDKKCNVISADKVLEDKNIVCFYFSAHWCPPCRGFTPILKSFYEVRKLPQNHLLFEYVLVYTTILIR